MKKQSFVKGAIILMIANAISKILGAVFKIPLTYILQEEGMAIYNSAFGIYILFLSFIISGLPFAISKLVSEYNEKKEHNMVSAVISVSTALLLFIGILGTIMLYFGADFFALAMKEPRSVFAIKMISPSVFFVALGCVYKNYFQGVSNMIPTAVSQIVEALIKLCAGYMLAIYFIKTGTQAASGGATLGVSIGEALATLILFIFYISLKKNHTHSSLLERRVVLSKIGTIAIPLLFTSVISSMLSVMDTTLLRAKLIEFGHSIDEARFIYGAYSGYALTLFHLPVGILATLGVSILPLIAGSISTGNTQKAKKATVNAIKLTVILSLPCAVAIFFIGKDMLELLFNNTYSANMLMCVSPCIFFLCVAQISNAISQSAGKIIQSFLCAFISSALKLAMYLILIKRMSIYGAIISSDIAYFIFMIISLVLVKRTIHFKMDYMNIFVKPLLSTVAMAVTLFLIHTPIDYYIHNICLCALLKCAFSGGVYILTLVLVNGISIKDLKRGFKSP